MHKWLLKSLSSLLWKVHVDWCVHFALRVLVWARGRTWHVCAAAACAAPLVSPKPRGMSRFGQLSCSLLMLFDRRVTHFQVNLGHSFLRPQRQRMCWGPFPRYAMHIPVFEYMAALTTCTGIAGGTEACTARGCAPPTDSATLPAHWRLHTIGMWAVGTCVAM